MPTPDHLQHLTINTGHLRQSPRSEVGDEAIAALEPLLRSGTHHLPAPLDNYTAWATEHGNCLMVSVNANTARPVAMFGICPNAILDSDSRHAWGSLLSLSGVMAKRGIIKLASAAPPPLPTPPWCAVVTLVMLPSEAEWLGDFERCLAWAWIEKQRRLSN